MQIEKETHIHSSICQLSLDNESYQLSSADWKFKHDQKENVYHQEESRLYQCRKKITFTSLETLRFPNLMPLHKY